MLSHRSILILPLQIPIGESPVCHALGFPSPPPAHDHLLETSFAQPQGASHAIGSSKVECLRAQMRSGLPKVDLPVRKLPTTSIVADIGQWHSGALGEAPRSWNISAGDIAVASDPSRQRAFGRRARARARSHRGRTLPTLEQDKRRDICSEY